MALKFLFPTVALVGALIAAGDYHYYRKVHAQYAVDTASLSRDIAARARENIDVAIKDRFLGLEVIPGRHRDELGIRTSWIRTSSTQEPEQQTRFTLVFDARVYAFGRHLFLHQPCFRGTENAAGEMQPARPGREGSLLLDGILGERSFPIASPGPASAPVRAGLRARVVTRVRVSPGKTVFDTGLPRYRDEAYVTPPERRAPSEACPTL